MFHLNFKIFYNVIKNKIKKEDVIYFISMNMILPNVVFYTDPIEFTTNSINNMFLNIKDPLGHPIKKIQLYL